MDREDERERLGCVDQEGYGYRQNKLPILRRPADEALKEGRLGIRQHGCGRRHGRSYLRQLILLFLECCPRAGAFPSGSSR